MKIFTMLICFIFAGISFADLEHAHEKIKDMSDKATITKTQTTCPILGAPISRTIYADHEGKRVYFCCQDCVKEFKKDPAKVIKKMEAEGIVLERIPQVKK